MFVLGQGEHTTLFHVTWRHMALLSQDQLYELANKLCVRLGNLQKVLPCYRSALHDHTVMVCIYPCPINTLLSHQHKHTTVATVSPCIVTEAPQK